MGNFEGQYLFYYSQKFEFHEGSFVEDMGQNPIRDPACHDGWYTETFKILYQDKKKIFWNLRFFPVKIDNLLYFWFCSIKII